ncbi:MAG TPA: adenylate kinase [Gemmatimonadetes bacterium]|nr:adenylate kinase [Gemmatimonadota bacterium]
MDVILLGPPGVGKGTQGVLLADAMSWQRVVTGDLLRAAKDAGTPLGQQAQQYMSIGELVPDQLIIEMVKEKLAALPAGTGVLFDGFPRTEAQASAFSMMLKAMGRKIDYVIVLEASDEVLTERISGRRSCPSCGSVYNTVLAPPQREGVCDKDGTPLFHRADDTVATVQNRLNVYSTETEPLIAYYEGSRATVHHIKGDQGVDEVQGEVRQVLGV